MSRTKPIHFDVTHAADVSLFSRRQDLKSSAKRPAEQVLYIEAPMLPSKANPQASGRINPPDMREESYGAGTSRFLCRVPVANDVRYCRCGGVLSQRFNGSLFCRNCHREERA